MPKAGTTSARRGDGIAGGRGGSGFARALAAALLIFVASGCGDDGEESASGSFLALTYNVAGLPEGVSSSRPELNTPLIGPLLNRYDLVLVQESWQTPDPNPLAPLRVFHEILVAASLHPYRSVPMPLPLNMDPTRPSALLSDGLNRFSRFPFGELTRRRWEGCDNSSADCLAIKGFSFARTQLADGVCVDVYNLHGEAGNTDHDQELKDANVRAVAAFIGEHSAGRAVVVGGDTNMHLRRPREAAQLEYLATAAGLTDVCAQLGLADPNDIDRFFYRSNGTVTLTPASCRFESDVFVDANGEPLSDHEPLAVRFEWRALPDDDLPCL